MRTKISKPPGYIPASILCSLGGFLFGIDTGIIGPVTVMPAFTSNIIGHPSPTIHGLIVSSILIPAALASCFAGRVADVLGRPLGIAIGALVFGIGAAVEASSGHVGMFVAGRVVEGVGEGLYLGTLVVYICEISPPRHRGALTTLPQLLITFGLVTGFFTCYGTTTLSSSFSWRLPFILLASYSLVFSAAVFFWLPASPRWLTLRGRVQEASDAWDKLGVLSADREKILDQLEASVLEGDAPGSSSTNLNRPEPALTTAIPMVDMSVVDAPTPTTKKAQILEVFSSNARPRLLLAVFLMGMQQLSGIDGVLYYAPLLFQQAGLSTNKSTFLASGVSAILIFAVTIPATILTDRWSRRASTILGGLSMALTMFLMGGLYAANAVHAHSGAGRWIVIICIYVFAVIFSISWAVGIKLYAAEIQPQRTRATATSIAHGSNWLSNFLVALVTPTLLAKTSYGAYFMFGACTFATAGVCWVFMPETRGKSLDEIELAFQTSHASGLKEFAGKVQKKLFSKRPATVEA